MSSTISIKQLRDTKQRLGAIHWLDFSGLDLIEAHNLLGMEVKSQAQQFLRRKLEHVPADRLAVTVRIIRQIENALSEKLASSQLPALISTALSQYLDCLDAWSRGAELDQIPGIDLPSLVIDGKSISRLELALLLQDDTPGCQTGIYRKKDGSIILWHTEEDGLPNRFDKLRIATFSRSREEINDKMYAFIYPDLMPGSAFCWSGNTYLQATDSLHLHHLRQDATMLANIATWIMLVLANRVDPLDVIQALGSFWDGYACLTAANRQGEVRASVVEFAGNMAREQLLDVHPGSVQYHGNTLCDPADTMAVKYENTSWSFRKKMEKRYLKTYQFFERQPSPDPDMDFIFHLISSHTGGNWDYANLDVRAYFISQLSSTGMEIWLGPGPAIRGENPTHLKI